MQVMVSLKKIYKPSEDVVAREVEGEFILIPIAKGIGDMEDELYSLNESGKAIWDKLDGRRSLEQVKTELAHEFDAPEKAIEQDVLHFVHELAQRNIIVVV